MTEQEEEIQKEAVRYAKSHRRQIAKELADPEKFPPEENPVSVFMAGSPGAGKTEASIELLERLDGPPIIRIDPDELRERFPDYTGRNAWLFQGGVSILVEKIHDLALSQSQSFLLDGTLSNYAKAKENINRSLSKGRFVNILYVYQEPLQAWAFVQARERAEGRRIKKEHFIEQYFAARETVNRLKRKYGKDVHVDLLMKNNDNSHRWGRVGVDQIDNHIPEAYSRLDLERMLDSVKE
ncbi:MAG TPA: zeta toxin family protein [Pseudomonadales bacterium]